MIRFLDPEMEETFERDGYVVRRLLSAKQVEVAQEAIAQWTEANLGQAPDSLYGRLADGMYFSAADAEQEALPEFKRKITALLEPALTGLMEGFGVTPDSGFIVKQAKAPALGLHMHTPFTIDPFERGLVSWCSLVDCDVDSGALFVIPRSHRMHRYIQLAGEDRYFVSYMDELIERHAVPVPVKAGEAVIFDNLLLHGSSPNTTDGPRPVIVHACMKAGAEMVSYRRSDDGRIQVATNPRAKYYQYENRVATGLNDGAEILRHFPAWNRKPTLAEFEALLQSDLRPSVDFDPLEYLYGPEAIVPPTAPPMSHPGTAPAARSWPLRADARVLPAPAMRLIRRAVNVIQRVTARPHSPADE